MEEAAGEGQGEGPGVQKCSGKLRGGPGFAHGLVGRAPKAQEDENPLDKQQPSLWEGGSALVLSLGRFGTSCVKTQRGGAPGCLSQWSL